MCQKWEFRRNQMPPDSACPACGVKQSVHVRECHECLVDIAVEDAEAMVCDDGQLRCDVCFEHFKKTAFF